MNQLIKKTNDAWPAIVLMFLAPLLTEVLPGATRFSSIFVFPIEVCVWGGGAVLIRYVVRCYKLTWINMLFLAIALALAEECIIQQTSLAPMVIRLKGVTYARAFGVNYVYLLWALIYESVFVVFLPVYLVELIFSDRRERPWISKAGFFIIIPLFLFASFLAWFTWTHIARTNVFHVPVYNPPPFTMAIALLIIGSLIFSSLKYFRNKQLQQSPPWDPPALWILFIVGALWASFLFGIVLLGFGIAPDFPPLVAVCAGIILIVAALFVTPRWAANINWQSNQIFFLIFGIMFGSMFISFIGFIDTKGPDLYFKIITNVIAVILMLWLGSTVKKRRLK
ncbi:MAG: hypothetical protein ABJB86_19790 [Bacteroidota bacterium]